VPSGIRRRLSAVLKVLLCSPLVFGLMPMPANRSIGSASSAIGGLRTGAPCIAKSRVGLIDSAGVTGALRMSSTAGGGFR